MYGVDAAGSGASGYLQGNVIGLPNAGNVISGTTAAARNILYYTSGTIDIKACKIGTDRRRRIARPGTFVEGIQLHWYLPDVIGENAPGTGNSDLFGPRDTCLSPADLRTLGGPGFLVEDDLHANGHRNHSAHLLEHRVSGSTIVEGT